MAPPRGATLSEMFEPVSDDDFMRTELETMLTPDSQTENKNPTKAKLNQTEKRKPGRPKAAAAPTAPITTNKVAKPKAAPKITASRRTSGVMGRAKAPTKEKEVAKKKGRRVLEERTNIPVVEDGNETEEVESFDEGPHAPPEVKMKRGATEKLADAPAKKGGRKAKTSDIKSEKPAPKKTSRLKRAPSPSIIDTEIPETQQDADAMDLEPTAIPETEETIIPEPVHKTRPLPRATSRQPIARSSSRQPDVLTRHRRAGSASDTERASDPILRRKLGELTKKFENVDLKYKNLKELSMTDANSNFEKLRKSSEKKAKDQDDIIASLKKELTVQRALASESKSLRSDLATLQSAHADLSADTKSLQTSLRQAQNEVKTLSAKLTAARNASHTDAAPHTSKVPGSAVKDRRNGLNVINNAKSDDGKQIMKLKEDLYSDLSGLMIHGVKRLEDQDVYDCIQTGRNGTLRFNLSISHFDPATATPGVSMYDDAEFAYSPLLDEKNDRLLLEILPDYLTEEIVFPRNSAAKFYAKVVDCMSRRFED